MIAEKAFCSPRIGEVTPDSSAMNALRSTCHEMAEELRDVAGWWAGGDLFAEQYRAAVVQFESRKLARHRFTLQSAVSAGGIVHFSLRHLDSGELCASLNVDPKTGEIELQHTS